MDRIYETYLQINPNALSQMNLRQSKQKYNRMKQSIPLYKKRFSNEYCTVQDTFDINNFGYTYDKLAKTKEEITSYELDFTRKQYVLFKNIDLSKFKNNCYQLHVFILDKTEAELWDILDFKSPELYSDFCQINGYAGTSVIFGNGVQCSKCNEAKIFDIYIDVTNQMERKHLRPMDVHIRGIAVKRGLEEVHGIKLDELDGLPKPEIVGPLLQRTNRLIYDEMYINQGIQQWLKKYGWYTGKIDGVLTGDALASLNQFKSIFFKNIDDSVDVRTIMLQKRCEHVDPYGIKPVPDMLVLPFKSQDNALFPIDPHDIPSIKYCVLSLPPYLFSDIKSTYMEIKQAFDEWGPIIGSVFSRVDENSKDTALIWIEFTDQSASNILKYDNNGGVIGKVGLINDKYVINLDSSEKWTIITQRTSDLDRKNNIKSVRLLPTLKHMIGHLLGLDHSDTRQSIMSPFYQDWNIPITQYDKKRLETLRTESLITHAVTEIIDPTIEMDGNEKERKNDNNQWSWPLSMCCS